MGSDAFAELGVVMTGPVEVLLLHEDVFYAHFKPYRHPEARHVVWGGYGLEIYGEDFELVRRLDQDYVWTVVDGDNGDQWITPGIRHVNRICYLVAVVAHAGFEVDFRCSRRMSTLTPLGLKRQVKKLQRSFQGNA